jgi:hypothetical protein
MKVRLYNSSGDGFRLLLSRDCIILQNVLSLRIFENRWESLQQNKNN